MARYDRGYPRRGGYRSESWSDPWSNRSGSPVDRQRMSERPWVGGYRPGYQGGSGGIDTTARRGPQPGRDYWWLGEHQLRWEGRHDGYDRAYWDFDRQAHPRYSPIGGTYAAMGGRYMYHRPPRPLREDTWFSDWTHWF